MELEDQKFWNTVLSNQRLRSRFIRELEVQSILGESTEEHFQCYKDRKDRGGRRFANSHILAVSSN